MGRKFRAKLEGPAQKGTWTYFFVPFSVEKVFGSKAQVKVRGTVNGVPFRSSLFPRGGGRHYMVVNKDIRDGAGVKRGDTVSVVMEADTAERNVTVPGELRKALAADPAAKAVFDKFSFTHRKAYTDYVGMARQAGTRQRRAGKAVEMLRKGKPVR